MSGSTPPSFKQEPSKQGQGPTRIVLITGLSGAGKSTAAKCFEDLGYYCVDNLPLPLLRPFLEDPAHHLPDVRRIAVVTDVRSPGVADALPDFLSDLDRSKVEPVLLFLDTSDEILVRRYSETRRRHPLAGDEPVIEGIHRERGMLEGLRGSADRVIDTTELTIHEIRAELIRDFGDEHAGLVVTLVTFGFKRGIPYGTDMLFDVRFLRNPYFEPGLRELPGTDARVVEFLENRSDFKEVVGKIGGLLEDLLPRFNDENRSYLTVSIGCTGGRHRSVATGERLTRMLRKSGWDVQLQHRDVAR